MPTFHHSSKLAAVVIAVVMLGSTASWAVPPSAEAAPIPDASDVAVSVWQHKDTVTGDWDVAYSVLARTPGLTLEWYSLDATAQVTLVADLDGHDRRPNVAVDWRGERAMAVWDHERPDGDTDILFALWRGASLGWTAPASVVTQAGADVDPAVAFDQDGSALAAWTHETPTGDWVMQYARFDGAAFGAATAVPGPASGDASLPEIAFTIHDAANGGGHEALLAWVDRAAPGATEERVFTSLWDGAAFASPVEIPNQSANGMTDLGSGRESFTRIGISTDVNGDSFVGWGGAAVETSPGQVSVNSPGVTGAKWDGSTWLYPLNTVYFGTGGCHTPALASDPDLNSVMVYPYAGSEEYSRRIGNDFTYERYIDSGPLNDLRPGVVSIGAEFVSVWWGLPYNDGLDGAEVWWGIGVPDTVDPGLINWGTGRQLEEAVAGGFAGEDRYPEIDSMIGGRTRPLMCEDVEITLQSPLPDMRYVNGAGYAAPGATVPEVFGTPLPVQFTIDVPENVSSVQAWLDDPLNVVYGPVANPTTSVHAFAVDTTGLIEGLHTITITGRTKQGCALPPIIVPFLVASPSLAATAIGAYVSTTAPEAPEAETTGAFLPNRKTGGVDERTTATMVLPDVNLFPATGTIEGAVHRVAGEVRDEAGGQVLETRAEVTIDRFDLFGGLVKGRGLHAVATAQAELAGPSASVDSPGTFITELIVNGVPVQTDVPPNTEITLPPGPLSGRLVLKETFTYGSPGTAERVLNMIHLFLVAPDGLTHVEVIIGQVQAGAGLAERYVGASRDIYRENDAGTGGDVGDTLQTALMLPVPVAAAGGRLHDERDVDVYKVQAKHGDKVVAVVKPANGAHVYVNPAAVDGNVAVASLTPPPVLGDGVDVTPPAYVLTLPDLRVELIAPNGAVREASNLPLTAPERVELNVDNAVIGDWFVRIGAVGGSGGNYTIEVQVTPIVLYDQVDGQGATLELPPHDAPARCADATLTLLDGVPVPGVLRDDDYSDFYVLPFARVGDTVTATVKPEEGGDGADFDLFLYDVECALVSDEVGVAIVGAGPVRRGVSTLGKDIAAEGAVPKGVPDLVTDAPVPKEGHYVVEVRRVNGVANYYLEASIDTPMPTLPLNDAGSGEATTPFDENDAPDACSAALPLPVMPNGDPRPGPYQGQFAREADRFDHYVFPARAGDRVMVTVLPSAASNIDASIYTLNCANFIEGGDVANQAYAGASAPETLSFTAPGTGTEVFVLKIARVLGGGNYVFSIVNDRVPGPDAPVFTVADPETEAQRYGVTSEADVSRMAAEIEHDVLCETVEFPAG